MIVSGVLSHHQIQIFDALAEAPQVSKCHFYPRVLLIRLRLVDSWTKMNLELTTANSKSNLGQVLVDYKIMITYRTRSRWTIFNKWTNYIYLFSERV